MYALIFGLINYITNYILIMKKMILKVLFFLLLSFNGFSQYEEKIRLSPSYDEFSNSFKEQFNHLDNTAFNIFGIDYLGWRENFENPYVAPNSANAFHVWGSYFFPYQDGGMTKRWNTQSSSTPKLTDLDWNKIKAMSVSKRNELSPTEKADIYFGFKDFRITKHEMYWRGKLRGTGETKDIITSTLGNEGFCNGARAAGSLTNEPLYPVKLKSLIDNSIEITFEPMDIKMLTSLSYFYTEKYSLIGGVNKQGVNFDVHPATLDIALRAFIGIKGKSFFANISNSTVPNNVTFAGYDRNTVNVSPTNADISNYGSNISKINVNTKVYYVSEISVSNAKNATSTKIKNRDPNYVREMEFQYSLILNQEGNKIIDGYWDEFSDKPNNIWFASGMGYDEVYSPKNNFFNSTYTKLGNPYLSSLFVQGLLQKSQNR